MSELKEYKLGEIALIIDCEHKTAPTVEDSEFYSVRTANISNGKIDLQKCNRVSEDTYNKWTNRAVPTFGDIILAREAPVGEVGFVELNKKICLGQRTVLIRIQSDAVESKFLLYYFVNPKNKAELIERSAGSVVEHLNVKDIRNLSLSLPSISQQKFISSILTSLDDKIDLLHRQNATLEKIAETLFRKKFVETVNETSNSGKHVVGLTSGKFENWIKETVGGEWGKEVADGDFMKAVFCIRGTDIADMNVGLPERTPIRFVKESKFKNIEPQEGDIIIEISGGTESQSTGRVCYINNEIKGLFKYPIVFSNFCRMIRVKKPEYSFFLYCYLQYLYNQDEFFNIENGSSGIKNLDYKALLFELEYPMPEEERVIEFHTQVEPLFKKVNRNKMQIRTLTALRDSLLPKLMSGELRVEIEN